MPEEPRTASFPSTRLSIGQLDKEEPLALITSFEQIQTDRQAIHGSVECGWRIFAVDDNRILQLDTYGSADRNLPGKVSQSIQLDEDGARRLVGIIREAFPSL